MNWDTAASHPATPAWALSVIASVQGVDPSDVYIGLTYLAEVASNEYKAAGLAALSEVTA